MTGAISAPQKIDKSQTRHLLDRVLLAILIAASTEPSTPTSAMPDANQLLAPLLQELAAIKQQMATGQAGEELEQLHQQNTQQQQSDRLRAKLQEANDRLKRIAVVSLAFRRSSRAEGQVNLEPKS